LYIIGFLVVFPVIAALALLLFKGERQRTVITVASAAAIMLATIYLAINHLIGNAVYLPLDSELVTIATLLVDVACSIYIVYRAARHGKAFALFLAAIQVAIVVIFEFGIAHDVQTATDLYIDSFSVIMALVIGIVGSAICVYALGYMRDFQAHEDAHGGKDRRPVFFALMFLFLSAMFVIVFSNNLAWMFCGWELTTVCSFALIGYTRTPEAIENSFRQINMNLVGGLAFACALVMLGSDGILELDQLIRAGSLGTYPLPIMLLALAAFTKAAQTPFHSWLLGAMVAPTPTSALLHSSTMVKAGVFLLIKLAPCFGFNTNGVMVVLVGGFTFLACSAMAVSQTNAKRVLAYSTVANLGLIVACAGIGTPEAVWAAVFLLVFHAVAKSLLFCCIGTAEHHIGSRDIEEMDLLFERMPNLARFMALGMVCMFIAPFGMLIGKWATLVSIVESSNLVLLLILAFGSAITFMFWAKWIGKVLAVAQSAGNVEKTVHRSEWLSLGLMAALIILLTALLPFISRFVVIPYLASFASQVLAGTDLIWLTTNMAVDYGTLLIFSTVALLLILACAIRFSRPASGNANVYLSGVGTDFERRSFKNSLSGTSTATQRNWYLGALFGEKAVEPVAVMVCTMLIIGGFAISYLTMGGVL
jgi:ech hydrogenase subunit A